MVTEKPSLGTRLIGSAWLMLGAIAAGAVAVLVVVFLALLVVGQVEQQSDRRRAQQQLQEQQARCADPNASFSVRATCP